MIITVSETKGIRCQVSDLTLLVDPIRNQGSERASSSNGASPQKFPSAGVILMTSASTSFDFVPQNVIVGPGEYEIAGIKIAGVPLDKESTGKMIRTGYSANMDDIKLGFLGVLSGEPSDDALDKLGEVDILFIGVGAGFEMKKAIQLIKQIEPKIIIPLTEAKKFMDELGQKPVQEEKLVVKAKDIESFNSKLIWLAEK